MGFADYLEAVALGQVFGAASDTPASTYYIGLATGSIDEDGGNLSTVEVAGGSYARIAESNGASEWLVNGSSSENRQQITFPTATAGWGTVTDYFISKDSTGSSNLCVVGSLVSSKTILTGNVASFASGQISITLS